MMNSGSAPVDAWASRQDRLAVCYLPRMTCANQARFLLNDGAARFKNSTPTAR
jgi:hypothetical protein